MTKAKRRRLWIRGAALLLAGTAAPPLRASCIGHVAQRRFHDAAVAMRRLAESWGDQPYGAVLVLEDRIVGDGPSRVVQRNDASAHAEREAIRDARQRLGRAALTGSVLYSTSRPCALCEAAAREAGVACLVFGDRLDMIGLSAAR